MHPTGLLSFSHKEGAIRAAKGKVYILKSAILADVTENGQKGWNIGRLLLRGQLDLQRGVLLPKGVDIHLAHALPIRNGVPPLLDRTAFGICLTQKHRVAVRGDLIFLLKGGEGVEAGFLRIDEARASILRQPPHAARFSLGCLKIGLLDLLHAHTCLGGEKRFARSFYEILPLDLKRNVCIMHACLHLPLSLGQSLLFCDRKACRCP